MNESWSVRASARTVAAERLAMEGISDRRSVRPSRDPRGVGLGGLRALASNSRSRFEKRESGGGDRDASGSHVRAAPRRKTPGESESAKERSEDRVVKRGPPRSHLHRAAPSLSVPGPLVTAAFTGGVGWGGRHAAATPRGRARGASLGTRVIEWTASKGDGQAVTAPGDDEKHRCSSQCFGEQKSAERIGSCGPPARSNS
jgi:hypothetical protein